MAARKKKPDPKETARRAVYAALWETPKYVKLHALKDRLGPIWNRADAFQHTPGGSPEKATKLRARLGRVHRRLNKLEEEALYKKLGVRY